MSTSSDETYEVETEIVLKVRLPVRGTSRLSAECAVADLLSETLQRAQRTTLDVQGIATHLTEFKLRSVRAHKSRP